MKNVAGSIKETARKLEESIAVLEAELRKLNQAIETIEAGTAEPEKPFQCEAFGPIKENPYMMVIKSYGDSQEDAIEIVKHSVECLECVCVSEHLIVAFTEAPPKEDAFRLYENFLEELMVESRIVFCGPVHDEEHQKRLFQECLECLAFREEKKLELHVFTPEDLVELKAVFSIEASKKKALLAHVFNEEFEKLLNQEIINTIEVFFSCDLNLTDTANKLFIHRNTLLYRMEKIQKATGLDLRKFSDCWKLKLAWMLRKEN